MRVLWLVLGSRSAFMEFDAKVVSFDVADPTCCLQVHGENLHKRNYRCSARRGTLRRPHESRSLASKVAGALPNTKRFRQP